MNGKWSEGWVKMGANRSGDIPDDNGEFPGKSGSLK
jgi:hypothetical protein